MNKQIAIILVSILLLAGAGIGYVILAPDESGSDTDINSSASQTQTTAVAPLDNTSSTQQSADAGAYVDYNPEKLATTTGQKVLFFHAPWCPQCRSIEKGITPDEIPTGTTIFKVDYDSNQDLRKKYGVTLQTTFVVVDDSQNLVKKHVGYDQPTFEAVKKALF